MYALSVCITLTAFWTALVWREADDGRRDRYLLFIAYLYGLGAGVHLQCLLTAPAILIVVYADLLKDRPRGLQAAVLSGLAIMPFVSMVTPTQVTAVLCLAIVAGSVYLRPAWRNPALWGGGLLLAGLGFSTYLALMVRSGLDPVMDLGNPENWENLKLFLTRQQYGTHYLFPRRAEFWTYQLNIHLKYFLQQFPYFLDGPLTFRKAVASVDDAFETISVSIVPLLVGLMGVTYHLRRNWQSFVAVCSMFVLMGVGLVIYLNMPDPEPREREYIFVGSYVVFAMWMGMGVAGLIDWLGRRSVSPSLAIGAALVGLAIPGGMLVKNASTHDRTGDTVARDYAYNLLETCEQDSILFTNGDNDTYPIWYLQNVEGVRRDVQVANLSFLKTSWYVRQLQEREPGIPFGLSDDVLNEGFGLAPWRETGDISVAGLKIAGNEIPTQVFETDGGPIPVLDVDTQLTWRIVTKNDWQRPIHFAMSVPEGNMAGLKPYLTLEGVAYRLEKRRGPGMINVSKMDHSLMDLYEYESVSDPDVYKDEVALRLWHNYLVAFDSLTQAYVQLGEPDRGLQVMQKAEKSLPPKVLGQKYQETWAAVAQRYLLLADLFARDEKHGRAAECLENYVRLNPKAPGRGQIQRLIKQWKS